MALIGTGILGLVAWRLKEAVTGDLRIPLLGRSLGSQGVLDAGDPWSPYARARVKPPLRADG